MKHKFEDFPRALVLILILCFSGIRVADAQETGGFNFGLDPFSDGLHTPIINIHSNWPFASNPGGLLTTPPLLASFTASTGDSFGINSLTNPFDHNIGLLGGSPSLVSDIRLMVSFNYLVSSINFDWVVGPVPPVSGPVGTLGVIARAPGSTSLLFTQEAQVVPDIAIDPLALGQHFTWYLPEPRASFEIFLSRVIGDQNYGLFAVAGLQADATSILVVPEPETYKMMLMGFGILGLVAVLRRQKAA